MAQREKDEKIDLSLFSRNEDGKLSPTELIAAGISVLWLAGVTLFYVFFAQSGDAQGARLDSLQFVTTLVAVFMPLAMLWIVVVTSRSSRIMRDESERLRAAITAMRQTFIQHQHAGNGTIRPNVEKKLEEIAAAQRRTDAALAMFSSGRMAADRELTDLRTALTEENPAPDEQGKLALETPAESLAPPLSVANFIRAMHFPESPDDKEGFRALRRALQDRTVSQLVSAAQDILTMLSQEGIYMDDLIPDSTRPETWRRFAKGERGKTVSSLGAIRDRSSIALASGRMRQDVVFRDSVHHFLRKFDQTFSIFEKNATDQEIAKLAETRTARAFMLLGRATGSFD
ncbi:MAG: hypothetical protein OEZ19_04750 [Paracoccaceae bacterium]|nr:hypothetical protein [Paracoccaceae bacterium]